MASGAIVFALLTEQDIERGVGDIDVPAPGGGTMRASRVNLSSLAVKRYQVTHDFGTIAAGSAASLAIALDGVTVGSLVLVTFDGTPYLSSFSQLLLSAVVSVTGTVTVTVYNVGPGSLSSGSGTLRVMVFDLPAF